MHNLIIVNRSVQLDYNRRPKNVKSNVQRNTFKKNRLLKFGHEPQKTQPETSWKESALFFAIRVFMRAKHFLFKLFFPQWKTRSTSQRSPLYLYQDDRSPIKNFYSVNRYFYRGAQPGITEDDRIDEKELEKGLLYLRDVCKVRAILNLRNSTDLREQFSHHPKNHQEKEQEAIRKLNAAAPPERRIAYYNIPIESGLAITEQQIQPILTILKKASKNPVFVHCKAGIDRTGLVSFLYRTLKMPYAKFEDLYHEMQYCGHKKDGLWQGYVKNVAYHLKTQNSLKPYFKRHKQEVSKHF